MSTVFARLYSLAGDIEEEFAVTGQQGIMVRRVGLQLIEKMRCKQQCCVHAQSLHVVWSGHVLMNADVTGCAWTFVAACPRHSH